MEEDSFRYLRHASNLVNLPRKLGDNSHLICVVHDKLSMVILLHQSHCPRGKDEEYEERVLFCLDRRNNKK